MIARALIGSACVALLSGCLATKADVQLMRSELQVTRDMMARADTAHRQQIAQLSRTFSDEVARIAAAHRASSDSLRAVSQRLASFQINTVETLRSLGDQLIQVAELSRQTTAGMVRQRAEWEANQDRIAATVARPGIADTLQAGGAGGAAAPATTASPATMFRSGLSALVSGSCRTARTTFVELLTAYPSDPQASDAQYYIAETFLCGSERNTAAADSVYRIVRARYPSSPRAASAVYKRGRMASDAGQISVGKDLLNQVIKDFPRSPEAALACEDLQLRTRCP